MNGISNNSSIPGSRPVNHPLGIFVARPWTRFLICTALPLITAALLAIAIWPLIPENSVYDEWTPRKTGQIYVQLTLADRETYFYQGLLGMPLLIIPPYLVLGTIAKLMLLLLPRRAAFVWRGWLLAGVCGGAGVTIGVLTVGLYEVVVFSENEHRMGFCDQWDTTNQGQWLDDDPRCGYTWWHWALSLIPGGGAGLIYWLVRYRPQQ